MRSGWHSSRPPERIVNARAETVPHFFVDRSLGRRQVPDLLRQAGFQLSTLAEVFGVPNDERIEDVEWLAWAGSRRWPVLMKDDRIRYPTS